MDSTSSELTLDQLRAWFDHKGLVNVVLRIEDVGELQPYMRAALAEVVLRLGQEIQDVGYLVLPVKQIMDGRFNLIELSMLQEIVACYREARKVKGYPMIDKPCDCGGNSECRMCEGTGMTQTLAEMSPEEAGLAYERKAGKAQAPQG